MKRARMPPVPQPLPSFADEEKSVEATVSAKSARPPTPHPNSPLPSLASPPRTGFAPSSEEPTRIPAPQPPPLDSGRFVPGLEYGGGDPSLAPGEAPPFPSPLGEPEPRLKSPAPRALYIALAVAALILVGVIAALALAGGSDGRGSLTIVSSPPAAEVRVDGVAAQPTPLTLGDVDLRQTHHVRVSKGGYDVWESDVKFPSGEREVRVQAVLVPTVGTVEIGSTPPGAEAIVNGRIRGMTPTTVGDLPPNDDVVIELRLRGYKVAHKTVQWAGKRTVAVSIPLEKAR
jgi:hypothetical protein